MKKSEKVLLAGTIGLGLVMAVTVLGGKGRQQPAASLGPAGRPAPGETPAAPTTRPTLELLAAKRVELKPLEPDLRNPFRVSGVVSGEEATDSISRAPVAQKTGAERVTRLELTGIFDEDGGLAALINGKLVRAGDHIGDLRVVKVDPRGVVFEYQRELLFKPFYNRLGEPRGPEEGSPATGSGAKQPENH